MLSSFGKEDAVGTWIIESDISRFEKALQQTDDRDERAKLLGILTTKRDLRRLASGEQPKRK